MTAVRPAPGAPVPIDFATRTPGHAGRVAAASVGIVIGAVALVAVLVYLLAALGAVGVVVAALAALVPFAIVLLVIRWIDRWEPEPRAALAFAALWGAGVSVVVALLFDLGVQIAVNAVGTRPSGFLQAVVQAPLVEEGAKGFGVLLIFWFNRKHFDGPLDGIVYAATVAGGFAFSENILYFGRTVAESGIGGDFLVIFIARGIFSPFAHLLFTACTGYAIGKAAERGGALAGIVGYVVGLIPAVLLHALWNGGIGLAKNTLEYYFFVQVPIFLAAVGIVLAVRARERSVTRARLGEYAQAGWFTPAEVGLLSTWSGRRQAMRWADVQPDAHRKRVAMKRFVRDATRLGHTRQRVVRGRATIGRTPDEQELLDRITADRAVLTT